MGAITPSLLAGAAAIALAAEAIKPGWLPRLLGRDGPQPDRVRRQIVLAVVCGQVTSLVALPVLVAPQIVSEAGGSLEPVLYVGVTVTCLIPPVALALRGDVVPARRVLLGGVLLCSLLASLAVVVPAALAIVLLGWGMGLCGVVTPVARVAAVVGSDDHTSGVYGWWLATWNGLSGLWLLSFAESQGWRATLLVGSIACVVLATVVPWAVSPRVLSMDGQKAATEPVEISWAATRRWLHGLRNPLVLLAALNMFWVGVWVAPLPALADASGAGPEALGWLRAITLWIPQAIARAWLRLMGRSGLWPAWLVAGLGLTALGAVTGCVRSDGGVDAWLLGTTAAYTVALAAGHTIDERLPHLVVRQAAPDKRIGAAATLEVPSMLTFQVAFTVGWVGFQVSGAAGVTLASLIPIAVGLLVSRRYTRRESCDRRHGGAPDGPP